MGIKTWTEENMIICPTKTLGSCFLFFLIVHHESVLGKFPILDYLPGFLIIKYSYESFM